MNAVDRHELDEAVARAYREEEKLDALRADYRIVTASRFYALHQACEALRLLFVPAARRSSDAAFRAAPTNGAVLSTEALARLTTTWNERVAKRPLCADPLVTVVIPVYNHCATTVQCLQSIANTWFDSLRVQIVLSDDGSTDQTSAIAQTLEGLEVAHTKQNGGFIAACNRGAAAARGKYICFLNNDTEVQNGWLDELVATAENDSGIGVVGAKLIYPDGRLQEAGGVIYRDGSGANYGRGGDPDDPRYSYLREVDYCSGAALLVRADLFTRLGGFSSEYAPAYYEDTDFCFAAHAAGYRVVYQPRSQVVHHEGVSSGTDITTGVKRFEAVNRPKFQAKWRTALAGHLRNEPGAVALGARRIRRGEVVLVIDSYVPRHDRESGSRRIFAIIEMLRCAGFHVIFLPDNYAGIQPYASELEAAGIEVLYHVECGRSLHEAIDEILPLVDVAWICRPELFTKYHALIRRNAATRVVYDTVDLHFLRTRREHEILGNGHSAAWRQTRGVEIAAARDADATVTVAEFERRILEEAGISTVHVIPTVHDAAIDSVPGYAERSGILFIGSYNHPPNVDAARWLCNEVMPLVWEELPGATVTLLGSEPPHSVCELAGERVQVPGFIRNVTPYFLNHRVFVAPLRFGAGLKGKVGQSFSFALPIVMTEIGAEGFDVVAERDYLLASTPRDFAAAIVRLYNDGELWTRLSQASGGVTSRYGAVAVAARVRALMESVTESSRATATGP
ncbi:MAG TPA: glycosyltransferase [Candidatus Baltobacteraceae bacterium]